MSDTCKCVMNTNLLAALFRSRLLSPAWHSRSQVRQDDTGEGAGDGGALHEHVAPVLAGTNPRMQVTAHPLLSPCQSTSSLNARLQACLASTR